MITIQPKFTTTTNSSSVAFKAGAATADESLLKDKADYYQEKLREFDETLKDTKAPKTLKTMAKIFKVVSEALFEGWLVAWGATKGSNVIKSAVISGANSKAATKMKTIAASSSKYIKKGVKLAAEQFERFKKLDFVAKAIKKVDDFIVRADKTTVGHYILEGGRYITKGAKKAGEFIAKRFEKAEPISSMNIEKVYDKGTKVVSTTLGVGAGLAGAYNSATNAEARKAAQMKENQKPEADFNDYSNEIDKDEFYEDAV